MRGIEVEGRVHQLARQSAGSHDLGSELFQLGAALTLEVAVVQNLTRQAIHTVDKLPQLRGQLTGNPPCRHQRRQTARVLCQRAQDDLAIDERLGVLVAGGFSLCHEVLEPRPFSGVVGSHPLLCCVECLQS